MKHMFVVGKYTLESLTNGMYSSPLDLYREYIQNAVDSIDDAVRSGIVDKKNSRIDISVNTETASISIKDNGCGIGKENAERLLVDIAYSKKSRSLSRGFRGIGRLAGLGYCDSLSFITTAQGEAEKTIITFDAKQLKKLLIPGTNDDDSIYDVINAVVSKKTLPEKANSHYFEVELKGVSHQNALTDYETLKSYLTQNTPLPFHPDFQWGKTVISKVELSGYQIPEYNVYLSYNGKTEQVYKPYRDTVVSDRVKKLSDNIRDIQIRVLGDKDQPLAIMWYASTNFYGTIIDNTTKGIRIRQGNILIGDNTTCSQFFKEERFNGWVIGEVYVINDNLIANSRRDNFEQNDIYFQLADEIKECATQITKELRKLSYDRSLSNEKKVIAQAETIDDVNALCVEDMDFTCEVDEYTLMNSGDSELEAENDFVNKLSLILGQKQKQTKYTAININPKLTIEQRKVLERVFDLICQEYNDDQAQLFINTIAGKF